MSVLPDGWFILIYLAMLPIPKDKEITVYLQGVAFILFSLFSLGVWASPASLANAYLSQGKLIWQLGVFDAHQGAAQNVNITGLIGDHFSVTNQEDQNVLFGLGYFFDRDKKHVLDLSYGVNVFYLASTTVKGYVTQEKLFNNLSYRYHIENYPVYLATHGEFKLNNSSYGLTFDLGLGSNFVKTSNFSEQSRDGGVTLPDNIYTGNLRTTFSATAGLGIQFKKIKLGGKSPLECGYRFFYLGQGNFSKLTNQVTTTLNTGNSYANALICSITVS